MAKLKVCVAGKRIGRGFVVGRLALIEALSQADTLAVRIGDCYVGRSGLIQYLRYARGAASTVKIVPADNRLRFEQGTFGSLEVPNYTWIKSKQAVSAEWDAVYVEVREQKDHYFDNIGAREFATALERALLITADRWSQRPVFKKICLFGDGRCLRIYATDRYRAGEFTVPCSAQGQALVDQEEALSIMRMLKKASRARIDFQTKVYEVYTEGRTVQAETGYCVVRAGSLKLETYPSREKHPLQDGLTPEIVPDDSIARAYLSAREASEILRAVGMAAFDADNPKKALGVRVTVKPRKVIFATLNGVSLNASMEAVTEGTGEAYLNAKLLLPILRSLGTEVVEFGVREGTVPVTLAGDGFFYLVLPLSEPDAVPKEEPEEAPEEAPAVAEAQPETEAA